MADNPLRLSDTTIDGALKYVYENYRVNAFPKLTPLLAQIGKGKAGGPQNMQWGGRGVVFDVVLSRPTGFTASPTGYFPNSTAAVEKQGLIPIKRTYVRRQIDMFAALATKSSQASYIPLARKITQEAMDAATLGQQEVLHGDGRAIKGLIGTVNSTTSIVVASPYGIASSGRGSLLLDREMYVAVLDATDSFATVLGRAKISAVSLAGDNLTCTLDSAISGMAAGDAVVACTDSDTSFNNYPNGLINLTNRGGSYNEIHSLSAATDGRWDALRMVAGTDTPDAANPDELDIWEMATRLATRSGKDAKRKPGEFLLLTTPGLEKAFAEGFMAQRQWQMGTMDLKGGFKALNLNGLPLISDYWCPSGTVYLLHLPSLTWVDLLDFTKLSFEGAGPWRFVSGQDSYEVNFGAYWNTGAIQRNALASITGYTDANRYDHGV